LGNRIASADEFWREICEHSNRTTNDRSTHFDWPATQAMIDCDRTENGVVISDGRKSGKDTKNEKEWLHKIAGERQRHYVEVRRITQKKPRHGDGGPISSMPSVFGRHREMSATIPQASMCRQDRIQ
jgi:hypothetical protein